MSLFARACAAVVIVGCALGLGAVPASASTQPEVVVKEGAVITKTYGAIPGNGGAQEQLNYPTPAECSSPPGSTYCDVIPVKVQLPADYDANSDEFITKVSVAWDDSTGTDDMDIFVYDVHNVMTGKSNGSLNPEKTASADPKFNLVVLNATGPNDGYKVTFAFTRKRFTPVTEKPQFGGGGSGGATTNPTTAPQQPSRPSSTGSGSGSGSSPSLPPLFVNPAAPELPPLDLTDPDFNAGNPGGDLASGIFTGPSVTVDKVKPAKPVSAGVLIAVLGVVPLLGVGAGGLVFRRRASRLLQF